MGALVPAVRADVIGASADSFVAYGGGSNAGVNYGSSNTLVLKGADDNTAVPEPGTARKTYIKFALSNSDPVTSASLTLNFVNSGIGTFDTASGYDSAAFVFNVYGLNNSATAEAWTESGITWANAPGNNATSATLASGTTTMLLGTFAVTGKGIGTTVSFSSDELVSFLNADTNDSVTFIITRTGKITNGFYNNYSHAVASRETGSGPTLSVSVVPEAGSFSLLFLGTMFLLGYHGKRQDRKE